MTARTLHTVLRKLTDAGPTASDADLLKRYADTRDDAAFAQLVQRHGRLVWGVCRHLTRSDADADDAFQATFLVLLRNAPRIRDAGKLSAWLHGVAYRVCSKARLANKRRGEREQAVAAGEGHVAVPDSAWDRALAAVHEEVAKLPETLRVPFVLCCLEGQGVTDAAERLGWKLGTLSGRLTRAKDALLARLGARGLTAGAAGMTAVAVGAANAPAEVAAKAAALAHGNVTIPGSILTLSHGVIGMSVSRVKLLAAGVLLACGLGLGAWGGLASNADAQAPKKPDAPKTTEAPKPDPAAKVELFKVYEKEVIKKAEATKTAKWVYHYEPQPVGEGSGLKPSELEAKLAQYEADGWQFVGQVTMRVNPAGPSEQKGGGVAVPTLVFRKPADATAERMTERRSLAELQLLKAQEELARAAERTQKQKADATAQKADADQRQKEVDRALLFLKQQEKVLSLTSPEVQALKAEIAKLEAMVAKLSAKGAAEPPAKRITNVYKLPPDKLPLEPADLVELLTKMAAKKFGDPTRESLAIGYDTKTGSLTVNATAAVSEWVAVTLQTIIGEK